MPHNGAKNEDGAQLCQGQIKGQIIYLSLFSFIHTIEVFVLIFVYNQESKLISDWAFSRKYAI